ncbi:uncharacterized protein LOC131649589 [Vicia villosa]|uniref:uncharacterized protein LOC131649589 n=1 Tax=Vicia villosa TaxID=3911 RepID=UPI00273CBC71|nr:uncharacterized protein LOC131649589 [Vicia villosa]
MNPRNPYYLHPGENLGATIVAPPLDDNNYHNWSKSMKRALTSKNKVSFINGTLPKPSESDKNYELWDRANSIMLSWINRTLSPHIAHSTICFDSAFNLWEDLRERFTKGNHFRFSDLLRKIHSIQQDDHSLSTYVTDLKILWDELEDLCLTPSCSCPTPCTCGLSKAVRNFKQMEYITYFLKGLNDNYQSIRTQILILDPLPPISRVYSLIAQQQIPPASNSTILYANNNNSKGRGHGSGKNSMVCTNCSKTNHTIETCYFKHGFPPGYLNKNPKSTTEQKTQVNSDTL